MKTPDPPAGYDGPRELARSLSAFARSTADDAVWNREGLRPDNEYRDLGLAAATGGETDLDAELVAAVAAWFADREELYRGAGAIGPRVEGSFDDPRTALLAASGRDADWTPST